MVDNGGEFEDPLKRYNAPGPQDALERALLEDRVTDLPCRPFETVEAGDPVRQVIRLMAQRGIASVLVLDGGQLVGIFSERDVLNRLVDRYDELLDVPVREFMTADPVAVYETASPAKALNLMATGGFRHVPIVDVDQRVVGVLGPRRIINFLMRLLPE
jgi:CBS domain-containing protein